MSKVNQFEEKILTLNLEGKKGVNISKDKYVTVRNSIISILLKHKSIATLELSDLVKKDLGDIFDGKTGWYFMAVKLDLEARGEIERIANIKPQTLRMRKTAVENT
jgi:hypothetical protein